MGVFLWGLCGVMWQIVAWSREAGAADATTKPVITHLPTASRHLDVEKLIRKRVAIDLKEAA